MDDIVAQGAMIRSQPVTKRGHVDMRMMPAFLIVAPDFIPVARIKELLDGFAAGHLPILEQTGTSRKVR